MYPDSDPRSWNYVRKYDRPPLHLGRVLLLCGISCGICALCALAVNRWLGFSWGGSVAAGLAVLAVIAAAESKKIAIWLVKLYQRLAPISVRSMCRFEPTIQHRNLHLCKIIVAIRFGATYNTDMG